jgi:L-lactate permease
MNVALATAVSKISGQEGKVIRKTMMYALPMTFLIGLLGI